MTMAYHPQTWANVERLKATGLSYPEISRRTGIPRSTIYMHFRREVAPERAEPARDSRSGSVVAPLLALVIVIVEVVSIIRQGRR
jgi:hypothetical protein